MLCLLLLLAAANRLRQKSTSYASQNPPTCYASHPHNLLVQDHQERARLFRELHAFRLCRQPRPREAELRYSSRVHALTSGEPLNDWRHLSFSVKFLVEVTCSLWSDCCAKRVVSQYVCDFGFYVATISSSPIETPTNHFPTSKVHPILQTQAFRDSSRGLFHSVGLDLSDAMTLPPTPHPAATRHPPATPPAGHPVLR